MTFKRLYGIKAIFTFMVSWAIILGMFPSGGFCMPVGSYQSASISTSRATDIASISAILSRQIVKNKLKNLGLSEDRVMARLENLSDNELHRLALRVNKIHAGGDGGGIALALVLIVLIIVAILYFTDRAIKIEKKHP